jgi:hypothetical protein
MKEVLDHTCWPGHVFHPPRSRGSELEDFVSSKSVFPRWESVSFLRIAQAQKAILGSKPGRRQQACLRLKFDEPEDHEFVDEDGIKDELKRKKGDSFDLSSEILEAAPADEGWVGIEIRRAWGGWRFRCRGLTTATNLELIQAALILWGQPLPAPATAAKSTP